MLTNPVPASRIATEAPLRAESAQAPAGTHPSRCAPNHRLKPMFLRILVLLLLSTAVQAQNYGTRLGNIQRGGKVSFEPTGPGVLFDALDPALRKWYVPQELYAEYQWKQWEYSNYARDNYQRYVSTSLEGDFFYDLYGNYVTRGWLIYDWQQINPQPFGSTLTKSGLFRAWFNNLVVASDHKGQYHYAITVGSEIRTTLTPMTFSKPNFNGVQIDFASDKYQATILASRISEPIRGSSQGTGGSTEPITQTNTTSMFGGQPSTTPPRAGPWDSPNVVILKSWPVELPISGVDPLCLGRRIWLVGVFSTGGILRCGFDADEDGLLDFRKGFRRDGVRFHQPGFEHADWVTLSPVGIKFV